MSSLLYTLFHLVTRGFGAQERGHRDTATQKRAEPPRSQGIYHQAQKLIVLDVVSFLIEGLEGPRSVWAKENERLLD